MNKFSQNGNETTLGSFVVLVQQCLRAKAVKLMTNAFSISCIPIARMLLARDSGSVYQESACRIHLYRLFVNGIRLLNSFSLDSALGVKCLLEYGVQDVKPQTLVQASRRVCTVQVPARLRRILRIRTVPGY